MVSLIDSSAPFTPSEAASARAAALVVDSVCIRTLEVLVPAGIQTVLLKGPSVARWLYPGSVRPYVDVDLLVRRSSARAARSVLGDAGYVSRSPERSDVEIGGASDWLDPRSGVVVDLHTSLNLLEHLSEKTLWAAVTANLAEIEILGRPVPVLAEPLRALHVTFHALGHELQPSPQARRDLQRLLEVLSIEEWRGVARIAENLDALAELAQALRLEPRGVEVARRLQLPARVSPRSMVRRLYPDDVGAHALSFSWWAALPLGDKLRFLRVKLMPRPDYLRDRSELARRGGIALVVAYPVRVVIVSARAIRAVASWIRAKRKADP